MAIVSANYIAYRNAESSVQDRYIVSRATRKMLVIVDDKEDDETTIAASGLIPPVYSPFPGNPFLFLKNVKIGNDYPWRGWVVTLEYDNEPFEPPPQDDNPLSEPLRLGRVNFASASVAIDRDLRGLAILTANGEPFDPPPMADIRAGTIELKRNYPAVPTWIANSVGAVNASQFSIENITIAPLCGRITNVDCSGPQKRNNIEYREMTVSVDVRDKPYIQSGHVLDIQDYKPTDNYGPHDTILLHAGFRVRDSVGGPIMRGTDDDGNPLQSPVMLDSKGFKIDNPDSSNVYYIYAMTTRRVDFNAIFSI